MQTRNSTDVLGIDVSNHNGTIDWFKVAQSGVTFAFAKATEGATYHDPTFATNYAAMKQAGILRGAYCFARPATSTAVAAADAFVTAVNAAGGFDELPPVLDLEDAGSLDAADLSKYVLDWMAEVKAKTGRQGVLYASPSFISAHLDDTVKGIPLWIAHYGVTQPDDCGPFTSWQFWQYADNGTVAGISGQVDMDVFAGTLDELRQFSGIGASSAQVKPTTKPAVNKEDEEDVKTPELQQGTTGHTTAVKAVQGAVGTPVDGIYGVETKAAVEAFQKAHGLQVDGIVGPQTWGKILS